MALSDGLIAYYKLDETSGTTATDSVGSNDGTITGTVALGETGKIETSYEFSAAGRVVLGTVFDNSSTLTMAGWVYLPDTSVKGAFVKIGGDDDGYGVGVGSTTFDNEGNNLIVIREWIAWRVDGAIGTGWHHIAMTRNGTTLTTFIDGVEEATDANTIKAADKGSGIGGRYAGTRLLSQGKLDEWGFWDRVLTDAEITELYNSGSGLTYPFESGNTLNFNIIGGSGTVTKNPDWESYYATSEVIITAVPTSEDYRFRDWSGDLVSTTNPETITMDTSKEIDVYFETRTETFDGTVTF